MDRVSQSQDDAVQILERALDLSHGEFASGHPTVLCCGGIYVPRPRPLNPRDPLYHILNTPNDHKPTKIVSALITKNLLDDILQKEHLN